MSLTPQEVAEKVVADLSSQVYTISATFTKAYFSSKNLQAIPVGSAECFVAPSGVAMVQETRGREPAHLSKDRTISIGIFSKAKIDAVTNTFDAAVMDDFVSLVEEISEFSFSVDYLDGGETKCLQVIDFETADYFDPIELEENMLLATILNITYRS